MTIGVAIITHTAKHHLRNCLPPILNSSLNPHVVVVNSSSNDGTVELAQELGADTLVIPRSEFNHGKTREKARKYLNTDIVVMLTPDAYAIDNDTIAKLIEPIITGEVSVTYGRQVPHDGASFFEAFPRKFNYPDKSNIRSIDDLNKYGVYTYFCSNSCAAYLNSSLDEVGGFPEVLLGEDTVVVAKLLNKGHKVAYVSEAIVKHSHRYTLKQEFQRNFDTGLARRGYGYLLKSPTSDYQRGANFFKEMCKELFATKPHLLPYAITQSTAKYSGYFLGKYCYSAPKWIKKIFSSQDFYWKN